MSTDARFKEIAEKVMAGDMSQAAGAAALGVPFHTFRYRMDKEYPDRKRGQYVKREFRSYPNGTGRPFGSGKYESVLETVFTDEELCKVVDCMRCPLNHPEKGCQGPEGLVKTMLRRIPKRS